VATSSKKGAEVQTAFVFGGNGQIGSAIVQMLLARGYKVTILNRGKDYYHSAQDISPKVTHIQCDRFKGKFHPLFPKKKKRNNSSALTNTHA